MKAHDALLLIETLAPAPIHGAWTDAGNVVTELAERANGTLNYTLTVSGNFASQSNFLTSSALGEQRVRFGVWVGGMLCGMAQGRAPVKLRAPYQAHSPYLG